MRDLTTTEMEQCAGNGPSQNGLAKPDSRSIAYDPQGDRDNQKPSRDDFSAALGPILIGRPR